MCFGNNIFSLTATLDLDLIFILSVQFSQGDLWRGPGPRFEPGTGRSSFTDNEKCFLHGAIITVFIN